MVFFSMSSKLREKEYNRVNDLLANPHGEWVTQTKFRKAHWQVTIGY